MLHPADKPHSVKFDPNHRDPDEEPRRTGEQPNWHVHRHGIGTPYEHTHEHDHDYAIGGHHQHGFHSRYWACSGDDNFGEEKGLKRPTGKVPVQVKFWDQDSPSDVFVPYVPGMLQVDPFCDGFKQVQVAPIDVSGNQYDYWDLICTLGERGRPFVIVEHDMVVPDYACVRMLDCPEPWCAHNYQTMRPNYEDGTHEMRGIYEEFGHLGPLGLTAFKQEAADWLGKVLRGWGPVTWSNLDTMVYRALKVPCPPAAEGLTAHRHWPDAGHLHDYPELRASS